MSWDGKRLFSPNSKRFIRKENCILENYKLRRIRELGRQGGLGEASLHLAVRSEYKMLREEGKLAKEEPIIFMYIRACCAFSTSTLNKFPKGVNRSEK